MSVRGLAFSILVLAHFVVVMNSYFIFLTFLLFFLLVKTLSFVFTLAHSDPTPPLLHPLLPFFSSLRYRWVQELDLSVHKFAFGSEASAREAFGSWSYVRVLTKRNREVDYVGMVFAPR